MTFPAPTFQEVQEIPNPTQNPDIVLLNQNLALLETHASGGQYAEGTSPPNARLGSLLYDAVNNSFSVVYSGAGLANILFPDCAVEFGGLTSAGQVAAADAVVKAAVDAVTKVAVVPLHLLAATSDCFAIKAPVGYSVVFTKATLFSDTASSGSSVGVTDYSFDIKNVGTNGAGTLSMLVAPVLTSTAEVAARVGLDLPLNATLATKTLTAGQVAWFYFIITGAQTTLAAANVALEIEYTITS